MSNKEKLYIEWKNEESTAHIHGWDFSQIHGRYDEEHDLPWDYEQIVRGYLEPEMKLMDIDTGGAEFLLSLHHPYANTSCMEAYEPNVELCNAKLLPLGIDFRQGNGRSNYPFSEDSFDLVINRHGDFNPEEIKRVLKPNGVFITEQVGAENDRALVDLLLPGTPLPFPELYLKNTESLFEQAGMTIRESQEAYRPIRFFDVGALVWFAHIIEWEFPGFTVDRCLDQLYQAQTLIEENGVLEGKIHRFLLVAVKK